MNTLREAVEEYIVIRRGLGTQLLRPAAALRRFIDFLEDEKAEFVTTELAVRWAIAPTQARPSTWAERLGVVRQFAAWLTTLDPRTEIPPPGLLPARRRRKAPYIYSEEEIERIMAEAARLPSPTGLRALTFRTLVGLLVATGLRPGEAFALDVPDVDLHADVLAVRKTKFGKTRFIPFLASTHTALADYAALRDRAFPRREGDAFLISERGTRLYQETAAWTFARVSCAVGVRAPAGGTRKGCGPRLIDLRHTFATRRLIDWYREGLDVDREIPKLSTYLGHVHVRHTYWYIEAVPELLQLASDRSMTHREGDVR